MVKKYLVFEKLKLYKKYIHIIFSYDIYCYNNYCTAVGNKGMVKLFKKTMRFSYTQ